MLPDLFYSLGSKERGDRDDWAQTGSRGLGYSYCDQVQRSSSCSKENPQPNHFSTQHPAFSERDEHSCKNSPSQPFPLHGHSNELDDDDHHEAHGH